jgi:hypothetical protein
LIPDFPLVSAPQPALRLIPSRFPPIGAFDDVASQDDLAAVMELEGWTNDRLVEDRLARLPREEWVYGRANASIVMAAFLHGAPEGSRFNGPELGAWYAGTALNTAVAEVAHHMRREIRARGSTHLTRDFRCYSATLVGERYQDLRVDGAGRAGLLSPGSYAVSQPFGEAWRQAGGDGIVYPSLRHVGGISIVALRPSQVQNVIQSSHYRLDVGLQGAITVTTLPARA